MDLATVGEMKPVNPEGNLRWIFIGRTDPEAEAPILWPPDAKSQLTEKDPDAGKDWGQEKGTTEDEMVGWHHQLSWHEFEQTPGDSEGQGSLACCSPWGLKESDTTELNNNSGGRWKRIFSEICFLNTKSTFRTPMLTITWSRELIFSCWVSWWFHLRKLSWYLGPGWELARNAHRTLKLVSSLDSVLVPAFKKAL